MRLKIHIGLLTAAAAIAVACGQSSPASPSAALSGTPGAAPDGSTLKIAAPTLVSPTNNFQPAPGQPVQLTLTNVSGKYTSFPVTYEVEVRNAGGTLVASARFPAGAGATTSAPLQAQLQADSPHTWRARAVYENAVGPWSATANFRSPVLAFLDRNGRRLFNPLTTGFTVGVQHGGQFLPGLGWRTTSHSDSIEYDIETCSSCRLEFELTEFESASNLFGLFDPRFLAMGDGSTFDSFQDFRDHDWKMHLEMRSDHGGKALEFIWRNGDGGEGNPGDHNVGPFDAFDFDSNEVYRFALEWTPAGFTLFINDEEIAEESFDGLAYEPPNHRISLGCRPRGDSMRGIIYRNVSLRPI